MDGQGRVNFSKLMQAVGMVGVTTAGDDGVIAPQTGVGQGKTNAPIGAGNQDGLTHMNSFGNEWLSPVRRLMVPSAGNNGWPSS